MTLTMHGRIHQIETHPVTEEEDEELEEEAS